MKTTIHTQDHSSVIAAAIQRAMPAQSEEVDVEIVAYERESIRSSGKRALAVAILTLFLDVFCIGAAMSMAWGVKALMPNFSSVAEKKTAASQEPWYSLAAALALLVSGSRLVLFVAFWSKIILS